MCAMSDMTELTHWSGCSVAAVSHMREPQQEHRPQRLAEQLAGGDAGGDRSVAGNFWPRIEPEAPRGGSPASLICQPWVAAAGHARSVEPSALVRAKAISPPATSRPATTRGGR
jgi:hypothetical protein